MILLSRRLVLCGGAGALALAVPSLLGCRPEAPRTGPPPAPPPTGWSTPPALDPSAPVATGCAATAANIEGPYYRAGAPVRGDLRDPGTLGVPLSVTGRVLSLDCRSALHHAELDIWQADSLGHYDNDGSAVLPGNAFRLRGKVATDARGEYRFDSIVPGRYLNGARYRPAHIHVKVSAPGHVPLTTQLYFPGDPYNEGDPFLERSLIMDVSARPFGREACFDFVLVPALP